MRRRDFIAGLVVGATTAGARAQQSLKVFRIAIVSPSTSVAEMSESSSHRLFRSLFTELRRLRYAEGQNLNVERFSGGGRTEQYAELAGNDVGRNPDVIVTFGGAMMSVFSAATTSPVVGAFSDPVALGYLPSLAHPKGNITGVSVDAGVEIVGKRLQLLREAAPAVSRVAFVAERRTLDGPIGAATREAAQRAGVFLLSLPFDGPYREAEYQHVFTTLGQAGADALLVTEQVEHFTNRRLIVELVVEDRLPAIYPYREFAEVGGLMAFTSDLPEVGRHLAAQVDQVLRGTGPGDIPVYQVTKFELVINLKTAKALDLTIPSSLLARADEVIE